MQDPVTDFAFSDYDELDLVFEEFIKEAGSLRSKKDLELWQQWDQNGRKTEDLEPLINQVKPVINKAVNVYAGKVNLPKPAIQAEFEIHAINAIKSYDPNRAALHTHLTNQMKRGKRFITNHQNAARIPEHRIHRIGDYNRARDQLEDELGREPSTQEIADKMKWPKRQVALLEIENRKEVPTSFLQSDLTAKRVSEETELLRLLPTELSREENLVYEYLTGASGKPQLRASEIAIRLKMSPAKVSRLRSSIASKVKQYYPG